MKKSNPQLIILVLFFLLNSCDNDDDGPIPIITTKDFIFSIDENPDNNDVVGSINATINNGSELVYSLSNQNIPGALKINAVTGELSVADLTAFDFESNPLILATYKVESGKIEATGLITVSVNDISITANNFVKNINENPTEGAIIGTVSATVNNGSVLNYSINNQSIQGAVKIDSITGELMVLDASIFDFEKNTSITANYLASTSDGLEKGIGTITISVDDISISVENFTSSLDENLQTGTLIGTISASINGDSPLIYSLIDQSNIGALELDSISGQLNVGDPSIFDFEINTMVTATFSVSNGKEEATGTITIEINDLEEVNPFITTWETTTANESITIPVNALYTYKFDVDWGDGTRSSETGNATHVYAAEGNYTVTISGTFPAIDFLNSDFENRTKIKSIDQWGDIHWLTMAGAFNGCIFVAMKADDAPDLSQVKDMSNMFNFTYNFNGDIGSWDVSKVTNMKGMFSNSTQFNQDISSWDVSNVTNMNGMFNNVIAFDQDIGSWDVGNVTDMGRMFFNIPRFNQDISKWDVSKVHNMESMFNDVDVFNQDLSDWVVTSVTNCSNFNSNSSLVSGNIPDFTMCSP